MVAVAGFTFNIGDKPLGRQCGKDTLMVNFDDIDLMFIKSAHHFKQGTGAILQADAQARQTA